MQVQPVVGDVVVGLAELAVVADGALDLRRLKCVPGYFTNFIRGDAIESSVFECLCDFWLKATKPFKSIALIVWVKAKLYCVKGCAVIVINTIKAFLNRGLI